MKILGHEDVAGTRDCYIKPDNEEAKLAMDKVQERLESLMASNRPQKLKVRPSRE